MQAHDSFAEAPPYNVRSSDLEGLDGIAEEPDSSGSSGTTPPLPSDKRGGAAQPSTAQDKSKARMHAPSKAQHDQAPTLAGKRSLKDYFILRAHI